MNVKSLFGGSVFAAAMLLGMMPASAQAMRTYDVNNVQSWADALAICDVTKFLLSDPDLSAEVIISSAPDVSAGHLRRPYFLPPNLFYSKVMRLTYESVQKAGQVNDAAYSEARLRYARTMLDTYSRMTQEDRDFLEEQMKTCYALAASTRRPVAGKKKL